MTTWCTPLYTGLLSLHLNSSFPVSFPLTFVFSLTHFLPPLLPASALLSLIQLSPFPFQSACYSTPSFCEKGEIGERSKGNQISFDFPPTVPFPLLRQYPHTPILHSLLLFPSLESNPYQYRASPPKQGAQHDRKIAGLLYCLTWSSRVLLTWCQVNN